MPMHSSITEQAQVQVVTFPVDGATTAVNSTAVDMLGYDCVDFIVQAGAITGTIDAKVQDSLDGSTGWADVTTPSAPATSQWSATDDAHAKIISVYRPTKRYLRVVTTPTGGTTNLIGVVALKYRASGTQPVALHSTVTQLVKVAQN